MRVARGLFRLWIVISVFWIGGVVATAWWTFPPAELTDAEVLGPKTPPPPGYVLDPKEPEYVGKRRAALSFAAIAALEPPLVLLIRGYSRHRGCK
jgi:hypothetical protein